MSAVADPRARRHAGVFRRALRREVSHLRDRRRLLAMAILIARRRDDGRRRSSPGATRPGADARAYWAAVRIWLNGGDPYHPAGPVPALRLRARGCCRSSRRGRVLPWDVAWVVWRGSSIILLLWSLDWAYRRRPLATAVAFLLLGFPIGANLDTGNIDIFLVFMLWGAQSAEPRLAGLLWAIADVDEVGPRRSSCSSSRRGPASWGLIWLAVARPAEHRDAAPDRRPVPGPVRVRGASDPARLPGPPVGARAVVVAQPRPRCGSCARRAGRASRHRSGSAVGRAPRGLAGEPAAAAWRRSSARTRRPPADVPRPREPRADRRDGPATYAATASIASSSWRVGSTGRSRSAART